MSVIEESFGGEEELHVAIQESQRRFINSKHDIEEALAKYIRLHRYEVCESVWAELQKEPGRWRYQAGRGQDRPLLPAVGPSKVE